jgi:hypothetical protein
MNSRRDDVNHTDASIERALDYARHVADVAKRLTEAMELPPSARYAVLSGLTSFLLEKLYERERVEAASSRSYMMDGLPEEE